MATSTAVLDFLRTDLRNNVLTNPYWISSGLVNTTTKSKYCILFQWPTAGTLTLVLRAVLQIVTLYTAGTTIDVTYGTTDVPAIVDASTTLTYSNNDDLIKHEDITATTAGFYGPTTGNTSTFLTASLTNTYAAPNLITGAATNCPVMALILNNAGTISAGACRLHLLITDIPGSYS